MKKLIFLLLLAQTISFLYGDTHCIGYKQVTGQQGIDSDKDDPLAWRWGVKAPKHVKCYCNCAQYPQANYTCLGCGHKHVPTALMLSTTATDQTSLTSSVPSKTLTHAQKKAKKRSQKARMKAQKTRTKKATQKSCSNC